MRTYISLALIAAASLAFASCTGGESQTLLKCMTFNIRYDNTGDGPNSWQHRKDSVIGFIMSERPDVFGLQEALPHQLADLSAALSGYGHVGVGREDGANAGEHTPVFYDKERFTLLDSGTFWLSQYPDSAGFIGWDGACPRIATWAKLNDKATGMDLLFVNTHLDHVGQEAQINGTTLIMERIESIANGIPAILTGDFNSVAQSNPYRIATTSAMPLVDSYMAAEDRSGSGYTYHEFDNLAPESRVRIDYLFVSPSFKVKETRIINEQGRKVMLSDHNPVITVLETGT